MKRLDFLHLRTLSAVSIAMAGAIILYGCSSDNNDPDPEPGPEKPDPVPEVVINVSLDAPSVDNTTVTFTGKAEITGSTSVQVGVALSISNKPNSLDPELPIDRIAAKPDSDGKFTVTATGLSAATKYYYCWYAKNGDEYKFGSVSDLTTGGDIYTDPSGIDMAKAADLSSQESANCYMVSAGGDYKFLAVKGNDKAQTLNGAGAEILWESFGTTEMPEKGSIVGGMTYKDGYIGIRIPGNFRKGNALVALKDKEGNIIWSWHIWATDKPAEQVYKNNAGTMMDRNLGATTGTPGIKETVGLYYQWGRKDPFLGSTEVDASGTAVCTGGELPIVTDCTAETGTIDYTISHPTTFIKFNFDRSTGAGNSDWLYDNKEKVNGDYPIYEKERWTSSKSIYDPCPAGWRVPDGGPDGVWTRAGFSESTGTVYLGYTFDNADGSKAWYPAAGGWDNYSGENKMTGGVWGSYWSCTARTTQSYCFRFSFDPQNKRFAPDASYSLSEGMSVRCQKIQ